MLRYPWFLGLWYIASQTVSSPCSQGQESTLASQLLVLLCTLQQRDSWSTFYNMLISLCEISHITVSIVTLLFGSWSWFLQLVLSKIKPFQSWRANK